MKRIITIGLCIALLLTGCQKKYGVSYETIDGTLLGQVASNYMPTTKHMLLGYNENIYTHVVEFHSVKEAALELSDLMGERLASAYFGGVNWSDNQKYLYEITNQGTIYAVRGYDPSFRVCIYYEYYMMPDDYVQIRVYDHLNGITLEKGSELFTDRLHLEKSVLITYADSTLRVDSSLVQPLLTAMNEGKFLNPEDEAFPDLESMEYCQLIFSDKLGITTQINVYNGYVALDQAGVETMAVAVDARLCAELTVGSIADENRS